MGLRSKFCHMSSRCISTGGLNGTHHLREAVHDGVFFSDTSIFDVHVFLNPQRFTGSSLLAWQLLVHLIGGLLCFLDMLSLVPTSYPDSARNRAVSSNRLWQESFRDRPCLSHVFQTRKCPSPNGVIPSRLSVLHLSRVAFLFCVLGFEWSIILKE